MVVQRCFPEELDLELLSGFCGEGRIKTMRRRWGSHLGLPRAAASAAKERAAAGQCIQPSVVVWGLSRGRFTLGPGPMVKLEHKDDRCQVDGARGEL
jgi:hypothetical protein